MVNNYEFVYTCPLGEFLIVHSDEEVLGLKFLNKNEKDDIKEKKNKFSENITLQLNEYFSGARKSFDLKLSLTGTNFQKKVWEALGNIPYGETKSYKEIAIEVGSPKAFRAVGSANNKNPIPIIIPCHRVIGKNGKLVGFAGGLDLKEKLLQLEKSSR
ncbi:MAG: methylated-DNA--[protein]-cysteine S-methyltransferase [Fusobacterium sp.]